MTAFVECGGANLSNADLTGAILNSANLIGTNLDGAEVEFADFRSLEPLLTDKPIPTRGLTVKQIKAAKRWEKAYYDDSLVKELGLLTDHNAKIEEEQRSKKQGLGRTAADSPESPHDEKPPNRREKRK